MPWRLGLPCAALVPWCPGAKGRFCALPPCHVGLRALAPWFPGALAHWCPGALVPWLPWRLGSLRALAPWCPGALAPSCRGALVPWRIGSLVPWRLSSLVPWLLGALVPWRLGIHALRALAGVALVASRLLGALAPWCRGCLALLGSLVPWLLRALAPRPSCLGALAGAEGRFWPCDPWPPCPARKPWCPGSFVPWHPRPWLLRALAPWLLHALAPRASCLGVLGALAWCPGTYAFVPGALAPSCPCA